MPAASGVETRQCGGVIARVPPVFSPDARLLFCASGHVVRVYAVATGALVRVLTGHVRDITNLVIHPRNPLQLYSSSLDGTIRLWDYSDAVLLKTFVVGEPVLFMRFHERRANMAYLATQRIPTTLDQDPSEGTLVSRKDREPQSHKETSSNIVAYDVKSGKMKRLYKSDICTSLALSGDGQILASISRNRLTVYNLKTNKKSRTSHMRPLTCVAFHPTEPYVAVGDSIGQIQFWYGIDGSSNAGVKATHHWHAHAVSSLAFTADGAYLLSAGEEAVLVTWNLETSANHFLPRLGGPITCLSLATDEASALVAVSTADNAVTLVNTAQSRVTQVIQGLKQDLSLTSADPASNSYGLEVDPRRGLVATNMMPGELQLFDPVHDRHVADISVVPRQYLSRTEDEKMPATRVERYTFSENGDYLATVERRVDGETSLVMSLKFWHFDKSSQTYNLNTRLDNPHRHKTTGLVFHPTQPVVASCGLDNKFKIWHLQESKARGGRGVKQSWTCLSVGQYREAPMRCVKFSRDGSILAAAFGQVVTLWEPISCTLVQTLPHSLGPDHVRGMEFTAGRPLLISYSDNAITVWDLLQSSVVWSHKLHVHALSLESVSDHFVVNVIRDDDDSGAAHFMEFSCAQAQPLRTWSIQDCDVTAMTYLPRTREEDAKLVCVTGQGEMFLSTTSSSHAAGARTNTPKAVEGAVAVTTGQGASRFTQLYGGSGSAGGSSDTGRAGKGQGKGSKGGDKKSQSSNTVKDHSTSQAPSSSALQELFAAPSHVLPSVSSLAMPFFASLVTSTTQPGNGDVHASTQHAGVAQEPQTSEATPMDVSSTGENIDVSHKSVVADTTAGVELMSAWFAQTSVQGKAKGSRGRRKSTS
eukprot:TRINITY_DN3280_c0_g1_i2.p1 TRINITY_DN3280_c0_g1~~TRINITY_DN3280_c0_g1_i2.p1  ORF type:complete len:872 (-),score=171.87 TRINITY_DN3280_c0_g1_i2:83-2698(-)